jgi:hypothetical protein
MSQRFFCLMVLACFTLCSQAQQMPLQKGMTITKSVKIKKGIYQLDGFDSLNQAVLIIEGNNITVDFNHAVLKGSTRKHSPDEFFGVAVQIKSGKNITLKNLTAKGYKIALLARNIDGLKLENCDFSYNYRQHLNSTQEKEDISDWMSYHHNENDEWLRYGAAMYLRGCNNAIISDCKVTGGQNALMMMECNNAIIYNNDFSFNSGIGLGMYKCSFNKVLYNKLNFNVRGYSHGVYNRGQDSAGILVYEQSSSNLFYKNSVTHGGDGFFLWAGQTTMDTGKGGCNDNILMDNDFSYAPTNGVEVTFSRNKIIHNRIFECDHGIWGGYSFETEISGNQFRDNLIAIAIEHGLDNSIHHNLFYQDREAIRLWSRKEQPSGWGYAKYRDTRSAAYTLVGNSFNRHPLVFNLNRTDSLAIFDNRVSLSDVEFKMDSTVTNLDTAFNEELTYRLSAEITPDIPAISSPQDSFKGNGKRAGRKNILVNEWGPYNFDYPLIWNANPTDSTGLMQFDLLGPKGKWKIHSSKGLINISAKTGSFPAKITAQKTPSEKTDIEVIAEYVGEGFTDQFGNRIPSNKPYRFVFKKFFQPIHFQVKCFGFDSISNPIRTSSISTLVNQQPFQVQMVNKLDYAWWGGIRAGEKQYSQFLTIAEGDAELSKGIYQLSITWDDAVRVYLDEKLIVDEWTPSKYQFDESPNKKLKLPLNGKHHFRVEHVELGGFATLSMKLDRIE